ncbi:hypothetical protein CU097_013243 [Rhizopus azygosporus]|uniref:Inhibitor I9 domain-containing protein n=1 Tax=Rhizopus azygosporus TaxID=86630 RepID=A0A367JVG7_RHIAZ|nr:hypothetical protein CU097_013243 [Rhizopus azygosporus]CEG63425.1 hypothetical protein RMATCC62417_00569 [Rhizopus microsporus]CEJ00032.1 hypothetical protein RMCBS344292_14101 [Rhizopus microsporus]
MRTLLLLLLFAIVYVAAEGLTTYIVAFKDNTSQKDIEKFKQDVKKAGGTIKDEINLGIRGLIISLPKPVEGASLEALGTNDNIDFIEEDRTFQIEEPGFAK